MDIQAALARLVDKDSIIDLIHGYSYCVDHRGSDDVVERFGALFSEDCAVDFAPGVPPMRSRAALQKMIKDPGGFTATSHHNANILVDFRDDDHADVRTSVYAWHLQTDGRSAQLWGYYYDFVVRLPEGWRIAERQLRMLGGDSWDMEMHPDH